MKSLADLTSRVAKLEVQLENMLQLAKVLKVDDTTNLLDIEIRGVELKGVPYLTWRAGENGKTYWVPEVGEVGLLLSPAGDVGNAVFLPALNYKDAEAPESDSSIMLRIFKDGVKEEYDGNDDIHLLSVGSGATRKTEKAGKLRIRPAQPNLRWKPGVPNLRQQQRQKSASPAPGYPSSYRRR